MIKWNKILALFLLAVLSIGIVPLESFHHHEEALVACKDEKAHVEELRFHCDLCNFVLPSFEQNYQPGQLYLGESSVEFATRLPERYVGVEYFIPQYRGPPTS
jgi:hypothetical protein